MLERTSCFVRRFTLAAVACALVLSGFFVSLLHGQISEADKKRRDAFLKAREEMRTVPSATPPDSPSPTGKPKPAKKKGKGKAEDTPEPKKSAAPKKASPVDDESEEESPTPAKRKKGSSPQPRETPKPAKARDADEDDLPARATTPEEGTPAPRPTAIVTPPPVPSASPTGPPPDITVQKSGLEEEQGFEPPPPPPPRRSFFSRLFGRERTASYRYLSRGVLEAIRRAPVQRARWKFIIVHNSGTRQGNARAFDYYHRRVRRMQNGMAYHFVVGNGTSSGNGEVEIGERWRRQINGGHVHSDYLNNISLGICLVGDFNRDRPTKAQLEATEELIRYLRERCGKADGRAIVVRPHREMNPPRWATDCPGDAFPYSWFREF